MSENAFNRLSLVFGERVALRHLNALSHADHIDKIFPGLNGYEATERTGRFFSKTFTLAFTNLTVIASTPRGRCF